MGFTGEPATNTMTNLKLCLLFLLLPTCSSCHRQSGHVVNYYIKGTDSGSPNSPFSKPTCAPGRQTIVHLFEWKWTDIKAECTRFLGPYGYCGVQVSPPNENAVVTNPNRPWWERYQPVSYTLKTRSGNEQEFRDMVATCNKNNVRIYADVVFNHMTGNVTGTGTAGTQFNGGTCDYPGVPYPACKDFHGSDVCHSYDGNIHNYSNPNEVRNCRLVGLLDLRQSLEYVRSKIAQYLNHLIDLGVAGFRVDAAKHMWPEDLANIVSRLHNLRSDTFGSGIKPFIFQEVIDLGTEPIKMAEYFGTGRTTNFIYGQKLSEIFLKHSIPAKSLKNFGTAWGMPKGDDVVVFISNHDNQRGSGGGSVITFFEPSQMKIATAFMLSYPYGFPRIMSSYYWKREFRHGEDINSWQGPPHNADMSIKTVQINTDMSCSGGWVCEHRWRQVYNMVAFRNVVDGTPVKNWWAGSDYQIAFSRGNKGFIVINADNSRLSANMTTGLPQGIYCDVISGSFRSNKCTGKTVTVHEDGQAVFDIDGHSDDPLMAIHIGAKIGS